MTTAALRNVALGVAAIGVFLATARLLPSAPQEGELRLSLPEPSGQTLALLADLRRAVEAMARSGGGDPDRLRD